MAENNQTFFDKKITRRGALKALGGLALAGTCLCV